MTEENNWEEGYDEVREEEIPGREGEEYNKVVGHFKTIPTRVEDLLEQLDSSSIFMDAQIRMGGRGPMDPSAERGVIKNFDEASENISGDVLKGFSALNLSTRNIVDSNPAPNSGPLGSADFFPVGVALPFPSYNCKVTSYGYEGLSAQKSFEEISKEMEPQKLNVLQDGQKCDLVKFFPYVKDGAREDVTEGIENNNEEIYLLSITEDGDTEIVRDPVSEDFEGISERGETRIYGSRGEGSDRVLYEVMTKRPQTTEEIALGIAGRNDNFPYIKESIIEDYFLSGIDGREKKSKGRLPEDLDEVMLKV